MNSFAFFPISVPAATSALSKSPVDMCTNPYCGNRHNTYDQGSSPYFYEFTLQATMPLLSITTLTDNETVNRYNPSVS